MVLEADKNRNFWKKVLHDMDIPHELGRYFYQFLIIVSVLRIFLYLKIERLIDLQRRLPCVGIKKRYHLKNVLRGTGKEIVPRMLSLRQCQTFQSIARLMSEPQFYAVLK